ncbi:MAG TPA: hypothetical protein VHH35_10505, partial [Pyrinomonadaceae bacterium]|nr:hypothetical protein [Pyrinomonadaceae bacterium]
MSKPKTSSTKKSAKTTARTPAQTKRAKRKQAPKLPRPPKDGFKDIGLLSFGEKAIRKPSSDAPGAVGPALAGSIADRKRVTDTRVSPFRKICDLVITAADGTRHSGTAFFISPRTLVTCGHCLFVFKPGTSAHGMVRKVLVMPARNGETSASQSLVGWVEVDQDSFRVHERWMSEGNLDFDYGVIILPPDQPLGEQLG